MKLKEQVEDAIEKEFQKHGGHCQTVNPASKAAMNVIADKADNAADDAREYGNERAAQALEDFAQQLRSE